MRMQARYDVGRLGSSVDVCCERRVGGVQVVTEWCTCVWLWTEAVWAGMEEGGAKTGEESSRQARNGKSRQIQLI